MLAPLVVPPLAARGFARAAVGFDAPFPDLATALAHHGFIQIDPINICGRMHDLILRNRVAGYREGDLMRFLHGAIDGDGSGVGSVHAVSVVGADFLREVSPDNPAPPAKSLQHQRAMASSGRPARPPVIGSASTAPSPANGRGRAGRPALAASPPPAPRIRPPLPAAKRHAFEHHAPDTNNLAAFPFEAWPHLQGAMLARQRRTGAWSGRLTPRERELAPTLLAEIAARGPLGSEDFADPRRAHRVVWGAASLVKSTLQKLFFHGRLLIAQRLNNRRRYDLPERVLPAHVLAQPPASAADTARWLVELKLRQRRLVTLRRQDVPLVADLVQPLRVEGCPTLYCLRADLPLLEAAQAAAGQPSVSPLSALIPQRSTPPPVRLLAPLDPLIYDRRLTAALWNFDYTWEAYTPPARRVRGYYALPVLVGTELIGHVDPKADRAACRLRVISRRIRRGHHVADGLRDFARWLGLQSDR